MTPRLSVIIPTYNRRELLLVCVRSLLQSGVDDLEILVVDDGSTDDTAQAIQGIDERVHYLSQPNRGPAAARNNGVGHSRGEFLAFLDSDDQWLPGVAPEILGFLDQRPEVDFVFTDARMGNEQEGFVSWIASAGQDAFFQLPCDYQEGNWRILTRVPFLRRALVRNPIFIGASIMRRRAFTEAGQFDTDLCGAADWELWLRMASRMTFAYGEKPLAIYLRHSGCMSNHFDVMGEDFCLTLQKLSEKLTWIDPAEKTLIEERLRHHLFSQAYRAFDCGDHSLARGRFARLMSRSGWELRGACYWLATLLPSPVARQLRRIKGLSRG